jgi:uncharacterized protein
MDFSKPQIFQRPVTHALLNRLSEPAQRLQILIGPRQVGKTTLVRQILGTRPVKSYQFAAADDPSSAPTYGLGTQLMQGKTDDASWVLAQWQQAEELAKEWEKSQHPLSKKLPFVLVLDEIQLVTQWSTHIKGLWDQSLAQGVGMHVVLLGSAPLLVQKGLSESLTGRFELLRVGHWSFAEMNEAFNFTLEQYVYFGGYPGSATLVRESERWRAYVRDALVEPSITKDVLAMAQVKHPAILRRLFELGCEYSGQILALNKVSSNLGEGHTNTLAHHLTLLSQAGLLTGLQKFAGNSLRKRSSPPQFQVHNNALMTALANYGFDQAQADRTYWGRLVESTVGAHLVNTLDADTRLHYWNDGDLEVDFVLERRGQLAAIEVKSGARASEQHRGLAAFVEKNPEANRWLVGSENLPLGEFLRHDAAHWTSPAGAL